MCYGQKEVTKRKMVICVPVLLVFIFMAIVPIAAAADSTDFIIMYKGFFKDVQEKRYQKAWDAVTVVSKNRVAKEIADAAVKMNKDYTQAQVYAMLEKDTENVRSAYFNRLNTEEETSSLLRIMQAAQYSVKSSTKERVVLSITFEDGSKDFQIIQEDSKWKINFFDDLFR